MNSPYPTTPRYDVDAIRAWNEAQEKARRAYQNSPTTRCADCGRISNYDFCAPCRKEHR